MTTCLTVRASRRLNSVVPQPKFSASIGKNGVNLGDRTVLIGLDCFATGRTSGFVALGSACNSTATGGSGNLAAGSGCVVIGTPTGNAAIGFGCSIQGAGTTGAVAGGYGVAGVHSYSISLGVSITSGNTHQFNIGNGVGGSQQNSLSLGVQTFTTRYGEQGWSSGRHTSNGDVMSSLLTVSGTTTNATPTELFIGGVASNRIVLTAGSSLLVDVRAVARTTGAIGKTAVFRRSLQIDRPTNAASTTLVGSVQTVLTDTGSNAGTPPAGWALTLSADTTNGSLKVEATGDTDTILWSIEITFQQAVRA